VNTLQATAEFDQWLARLADAQGKARILDRLDAAGKGHFGDVRPVGQGVFEMRIHTGPGYRVYYLRTGAVVYLLLCGGDKSSQQRDIDRALRMATQLRGK